MNAYLEQRLGFNNTARLQGGIVSYARELQRLNDGDDDALQIIESQRTNSQSGNDKGNDDKRKIHSSDDSGQVGDRHQSMFRGVNYVFDERIGSRVTDDVLMRYMML